MNDKGQDNQAVQRTETLQDIELLCQQLSHIAESEALYQEFQAVRHKLLRKLLVKESLN